jgi:hypothetical protein
VFSARRFNDRQAIRFIMFARTLRILRIFADLDQFSVIFSAFFDLAPAFSKLGTVLLLIMSMFGQIAIPLFGGDIYEVRQKNRPLHSDLRFLFGFVPSLYGQIALSFHAQVERKYRYALCFGHDTCRATLRW